MPSPIPEQLLIYSWHQRYNNLYVFGLDIGNKTMCIVIPDFRRYRRFHLPDDPNCTSWESRHANDLEDIYKVNYDLKRHRGDICIEYPRMTLSEQSGLERDPSSFDKLRLATHQVCKVSCNQKAILTKMVDQMKRKFPKWELFTDSDDIVLQCRHAYHMPSSGWIEFTLPETTGTDEMQTTCNREFVLKCGPGNRENRDKVRTLVDYPKFVHPLVMSFDIECYSHDGSFPNPDDPLNNVFLIVCEFFRQGNIDSDEHEMYVLTMACEDDVDLSKFARFGTNLHFSACADEAGLLEEFANLILNKNPAIIVGYNILWFDFDFVLRRSDVVYNRESYQRLGMLLDSKNPTKRERDLDGLVYHKFSNKTVNGKRESSKFPTMAGRVIVDMLPFVRDVMGHKLSNYNLNTVANHFIQDTKDPIDPKTMFKYWRQDAPLIAARKWIRSMAPVADWYDMWAATRSLDSDSSAYWDNIESLHRGVSKVEASAAFQYADQVVAKQSNNNVWCMQFVEQWFVPRLFVSISYLYRQLAPLLPSHSHSPSIITTPFNTSQTKDLHQLAKTIVQILPIASISTVLARVEQHPNAKKPLSELLHLCVQALRTTYWVDLQLNMEKYDNREILDSIEFLNFNHSIRSKSSITCATAFSVFTGLVAKRNDHSRGSAVIQWVHVDPLTGQIIHQIKNSSDYQTSAPPPTQEFLSTGLEHLQGVEWVHLSCNDVTNLRQLLVAISTGNLLKTRQQQTVLAEYCAQDVRLTSLLFEHQESWISLTEFASGNEVVMFNIYTRGQQIRFQSQMWMQCSRENMILNPQDRDWEHCVGASVMKPIAGVYPMVVSFDFNSLYPSLLIAFNMCYTTWVRFKTQNHITKQVSDVAVCGPNIPMDLESLCRSMCKKIEWTEHINCGCPEALPPVKGMAKTDRYCCTITHWFLKESVMEGTLPKLLKGQLENRKRNKQKLAEAKQMLKEVTTDEDRSRWQTLVTIYDKKQWSCKIAANAMYGSLLAKTSTIPLPSAGSCITALGRNYIKKAQDILIEQYNATIVYGDTDSCYLMFNDCTTAPEVWAKALRVDQELERGNHFPPPMKLAFEYSLYSKYWAITKKRYMGILCNSKGEESSEVENKGDLKSRRDNAFLQRSMYDLITKKILDGCSYEDTCSNIIDYMDMVCRGDGCGMHISLHDTSATYEFQFSCKAHEIYRDNTTTSHRPGVGTWLLTRFDISDGTRQMDLDGGTFSSRSTSATAGRGEREMQPYEHWDVNADARSVSLVLSCRRSIPGDRIRITQTGSGIHPVVVRAEWATIDSVTNSQLSSLPSSSCKHPPAHLSNLCDHVMTSSVKERTMYSAAAYGKYPPNKPLALRNALARKNCSHRLAAIQALYAQKEEADKHGGFSPNDLENWRRSMNDETIEYRTHSIPAPSYLADVKMGKRGLQIQSGSRIDYIITDIGGPSGELYQKLEDPRYYRQSLKHPLFLVLPHSSVAVQTNSSGERHIPRSISLADLLTNDDNDSITTTAATATTTTTATQTAISTVDYSSSLATHPFHPPFPLPTSSKNFQTNLPQPLISTCVADCHHVQLQPFTVEAAMQFNPMARNMERLQKFAVRKRKHSGNPALDLQNLLVDMVRPISVPRWILLEDGRWTKRQLNLDMSTFLQDIRSSNLSVSIPAHLSEPLTVSDVFRVQEEICCKLACAYSDSDMATERMIHKDGACWCSGHRGFRKKNSTPPPVLIQLYDDDIRVPGHYRLISIDYVYYLKKLKKPLTEIIRSGYRGRDDDNFINEQFTLRVTKQLICAEIRRVRRNLHQTFINFEPCSQCFKTLPSSSNSRSCMC